MMGKSIIKIQKLGFPWETDDPFLMTVHHKDAYPSGNENQGPNASLEGRNLGEDFTIRDGFECIMEQQCQVFQCIPTEDLRRLQ